MAHAKAVSAGFAGRYRVADPVRPRPRSGLAFPVLVGLCAATAAQADPAASDADAREQILERHIEELALQLQAVRSELQALKAQNQAAAAAPASPASPASPSPQAPRPVATATAAAPPSSLPAAPSVFENLSLWGYGEVYYTRPTAEAKRTEFDLARAVFGMGYRFDARTLFNSEYEVEHAVSSAADVGEFEVEQFYIDRLLTDQASVRAGLILMPFGLLNEYHEPTNFYGVQRNFVETLIIPSTWREGGAALHGDTDFGLAWNAGVTSDQDLSKWDFAPQFPLYLSALDLEDNDVAPLQATHQELALAKGQHLAQYLALNYNGVPGLTVGASVFTGKLATVAASRNAPVPDDQRLTLWEAHARWMPGNFDIAALYAHGAISNLAAINAENRGSANPIPSSFLGYYGQVAYTAWNSGGYRLAPFVRWEHYDMGASYEGVTAPVVPSGLVPVSANAGDYGYWPQRFDRVWTFGANYYLGSHVVLKADYQSFQVNSDFSRYDLGLGLNF
ncbi:MAG TPA: porin [Steroidobacteraceae bacterium]|nr:porin [Steroidobacteraceae bacterium]